MPYWHPRNSAWVIVTVLLGNAGWHVALGGLSEFFTLCDLCTKSHKLLTLMNNISALADFVAYGPAENPEMAENCVGIFYTFLVP